MDKIRLKANAKLNLSLDVKGKREDGYHELWMIMQSVSLCDFVTIEKNDRGRVEAKVSNMNLPTGEENLAVRAANSLRSEYKIREGVDIHIEKHIPLGSGMAGGSADAAAVLVGLNRLWELGATEEDLMRIGLSLGADVPFAVHGGTVTAEGIGELLFPLPFFSADFLIVKPECSILTKNVFQRLDLRRMGERPDRERLIETLSAGNIRGLAQSMKNVLESVTEREIPQITQIKERLLDCGAAGSLMTGSGTAVFGIFDDPRSLEEAKIVLDREYPQVYRASAAKKGVELL